MQVKKLVGVLVFAIAAAMPSYARARPLGASQLVELAIEANPRVRAARNRYLAAVHSIKQAYAPNDPVFSFLNGDSPVNPIGPPSEQSFQLSESFQFPGKAMLQTDVARRNAEIARLFFLATVRDVRAATEAAYYQILLDGALAQVSAENVANLQRVLKVTQVAYAANQVTQADFINAEFDLAAARQAERENRVAEANDETVLNQLLDRPPGTPLDLDRTLHLEPLTVRVDTLVAQAAAVRQEILEAALSERNSETALKLARMEYLPDFTATYIFNHYLVPNFAPSPTDTQTHGFMIGFNLPVFFWLRQNEDVKQAAYSLDAARDDLRSVRTRTAAMVTSIYRTTQFAYETAGLYRDSLVPLSRQDIEVSLIAYQSGKVDYLALAGALRRGYNANLSYLQAANRFLAGRVALEQAIGAPLPK
jgi:outer membrane protein TolC